MGLLTRLGLRRPNEWEPPTPLDNLLASPLQFLVAHLYYLILLLRGSPLHPPRSAARPAIRVVCLSDTHDLVPAAVPDGDLLIHAGDLTDGGTLADVQAQLDWLARLPHRHKVLVCGNHDSWFDPSSRRPEDRASGAEPDFRGVHYLERSGVTLEFAGGRMLNVYGAPDIPECGGSEFAFQYSRGQDPWRGTIPTETDILVTHGPPRYHLDLNLGCAGLLEEVWRVRPRLHVFGHVHWGRGQQSAYFDDCQRTYEALMARPARGLIRDLLLPNAGWLGALWVVYYGLVGISWKWLMAGPSANNASLFVNAACMHGNTGRLRKGKVEVIDL
ncbi:Calcineurin-like phosphoesterase [Pleurostoma richardsiae]|uniref:Calcineurin-like phosphoesterase n=1 Tax=Pleurostoma richardsiae TaxID=41990 RepID=A0AA38RHU2_9PEZI|nr:Calcineurin-like phosphoesterase [Pleurostoma richardsiae]